MFQVQVTWSMTQINWIKRLFRKHYWGWGGDGGFYGGKEGGPRFCHLPEGRGGPRFCQSSDGRAEGGGNAKILQNTNYLNKTEIFWGVGGYPAPSHNVTNLWQGTKISS